MGDPDLTPEEADAFLEAVQEARSGPLEAEVASLRAEVARLAEQNRQHHDLLHEALDRLDAYEEGLKGFIAEHMEDLGVRLTRKLVDLLQGGDAHQTSP